MEITLRDIDGTEEGVSAAGMARVAGSVFPISERVPGTDGSAFDLKQWYGAWRAHNGKPPTHLIVEAADQFQATIPWEQLDHAAVLFEANGEPLKKGSPVRLYVPDGSSQCLNVKSIVSFRFVNLPELGGEASYGFKNSFSMEEMKRK